MALVVIICKEKIKPCGKGNKKPVFDSSKMKSAFS